MPSRVCEHHRHYITVRSCSWSRLVCCQGQPGGGPEGSGSSRNSYQRMDTTEKYNNRRMHMVDPTLLASSALAISLASDWLYR